MNATTNYRQNPFFTTVLSTISKTMSEYSGQVNTSSIFFYTYLLETVLVSILSVLVCMVCCMCRREDSFTRHDYDSTEYTLIPSTDIPEIPENETETTRTPPTSSTDEYGSTVYQQTRVYSPIRSSSVEPILQPQSFQTHHVHRIHRIHRTPRKPIPTRNPTRNPTKTFAKSIEELEYMV